MNYVSLAYKELTIFMLNAFNSTYIDEGKDLYSALSTSILMYISIKASLFLGFSYKLLTVGLCSQIEFIYIYYQK